MQLIGIPDEVAGEVPVAVIKKAADPAPSNVEVQRKVAQELGKFFSPHSIIHLHQDLSLEDNPKTLSGKVKKHELAALIGARVPAQEGALRGDSSTCSVETLVWFWAEITGRKSRYLR